MTIIIINIIIIIVCFDVMASFCSWKDKRGALIVNEMKRPAKMQSVFGPLSGLSNSVLCTMVQRGAKATTPSAQISAVLDTWRATASYLDRRRTEWEGTE